MPCPFPVYSLLSSKGGKCPKVALNNFYIVCKQKKASRDPWCWDREGGLERQSFSPACFKHRETTHFVLLSPAGMPIDHIKAELPIGLFTCTIDHVKVKPQFSYFHKLQLTKSAISAPELAFIYLMHFLFSYFCLHYSKSRVSRSHWYWSEAGPGSSCLICKWALCLSLFFVLIAVRCNLCVVIVSDNCWCGWSLCCLPPYIRTNTAG